MTASKPILRAVCWSIVAGLFPFGVVSAFLLAAPRPGNWDYRVGITLGVVAGLICIWRLPCRAWIRLLVTFLFALSMTAALYVYSIWFIFGVLDHGRPM